jgi:subtilase family serine protease
MHYRFCTALTMVLGTLAFASCPLGAATRAPLPHLTDLGRAPGNERVSFAATFAYRDDALLERLVAMQSDPGSPLYGHYLTNDQFDANFAPQQALYARAIELLERAGFTITKTFRNRSVIDATGTVAAADRFFAADLRHVWQPGYGLRLQSSRPIGIPSALRGVITSISGLETVALLRPTFAVLGARGVAPIRSATGPPLYGPVSSVTGLAGFGPLAFSHAYDLPARHERDGHPIDGTGRASGVVIDADYLDSDLREFLRYFGVSRTGPATLRIAVDGGPPSGDNSPDSIETTLDVETIVSNAPGTALVVYEFPDFTNTQYITDAYNAVVDDNRVDTANSSFGGCEDSVRIDQVRAWDHLAMQGAAKGITFHASTGDAGSDPCDTGGLDVIAPAAGPHFAAIGGTTLTVSQNGGYADEIAWNDASGATGGGVSDIFAIPAWQKSVPNAIATGRNIPDVAFDADPVTGAAFYYGGSWNTPYNPIGGTSLSSPIFGAAVTEIDQLYGRRTGLEAVALYRFESTHGYLASRASRPAATFFHDIVSGCNGLSGEQGYCAQPGFDQVSGIGSVDWWNVATH